MRLKMKLNKIRKGVLLSIAAFGLQISAQPSIADTHAMAEKEDSKASTPSDPWTWLEGTTWIVPPNNVPAYMLAGVRLPDKAPALVALNDQTVYTIEGYKNGFFWGTFVLALQPASGGPISYGCSSMLSTISPDGQVVIGSTTDNGTNNMGVGQMVKVKGQWTMKNLKVGSYTHWAYMVQSKPTDPSYHNLPFVHLSVQEMLDKCPNYTPTIPQLD